MAWRVRRGALALLLCCCTVGSVVGQGNLTNQSNQTNQTSQPSPTVCASWAALFVRRQLGQFNSSVPFDGLANPEHRACLRVVSGSTAVVTIGLGTITNGKDPIHPMAATVNSQHFIEAIYLVDQTGAVVGLRRPAPTEPAPAVLSFPIPSGTTRLTAFAFCNLHGLFQGEVIDVLPGQTSATATRCPSATTCSPLPRPDDCSVRVAALRAQGVWDAPLNSSTPSVSINGTTVFARVAGGGTVATSLAKYLWVEDQNRRLLAMRDVLHTETTSHVFNFTLPGGVTSLIPFAHDAAGGVVQGLPLAVANRSVTGTFVPQCRTRSCPGFPAPATALAGSVDCAAIVMDATRLQATVFPQQVGGAPFGCQDSAEHCPTIMFNGSRATVVVGLGAATGNPADPIHEMDHGQSLHFVDLIYALDQAGRVAALRRVNPWEQAPARLVFDVPAGTTGLTPYARSNVHGLFRGSQASPPSTNQLAQGGCRLQACPDFKSASAGALVREALRLQTRPHDGEFDMLHKAFMQTDNLGYNVKVVVGKGAVTGQASDPIHPMNYTGSPDDMHFIKAIWVTDQDDRLLVYSELLPSTSAPASLSFQIPLGTTSMTAFAECNRDGVYRGETRLVGGGLYAPGVRPTLAGDFLGCTPRLPSLGFAATESNKVPERVPTSLVAQPSVAMQHICGNRTQWGYLLEKQLDARFYIFYTPNFTTGTASFLVCGKTLGFVALGFPEGTHAMINSDMLTAYFDASGRMFVDDRFAKAIEAPGLDTALGGTTDLDNVTGWQVCADAGCSEGATFFGFSRRFNTSDVWDVVLPRTSNQLAVIWAIQAAGTRKVTYHGPTRGWAQIPWLLDCRDGEFFDLDKFACSQCEVGKYRHSPMAMSECSPCPIGSYAEVPGQALCTLCPKLRVTEVLGASADSACLCNRGFVSANPDSPCVACQDGQSCPLGSDLQNFYRELTKQVKTPDFLRRYPQLNEGCWASAEDPTNVFRCSNKESCPGGDPGTCGANMMGLACANCQAGFARVGRECKPCVSPVSAHLYPLVILAPVGVVGSYLFLNFPLEFADDPHRAVTNAAIAIIRFLQQAGLMKKIDVDLPSTLLSTAEGLQTLNFEVEWMQIACGTVSFSVTHWVRACLPLYMAVVFAGTYLLSQLLPLCKRPGRCAWANPLEVDKTFNAFLAVVNMFFVALVGVGVKVFTCAKHPSGTYTMTEARDVVCPWGRFEGYDTSAWRALVPASTASLLLYTVGFPALLSWACWVAPSQFASRAFRQRWLFLFARFQPRCFWWNLVILGQSLILNVCPALIPFGSLQAFGMLVGSCIYCATAAMVKPWRFSHLNVMDVLCSLMLSFCYAAVSWFEDPIVTNARRSDLKVVYVVLVVTAVLVSFAFAVAFLMGSANRMRRHDQTLRSTLELALVFQQLCKIVQEADADSWVRYMLHVGESDREVMGMLVASMSSRLLPESKRVSRAGTTFTNGEPARLEVLNENARRFWSKSRCSVAGLSTWAEDFKKRNRVNETLWNQMRYGYLNMSLEDCEREFGHIAKAQEVFRAVDVRDMGVVRTAELLEVVQAASCGTSYCPEPPSASPCSSLRVGGWVPKEPPEGAGQTLSKPTLEVPAITVTPVAHSDIVADGDWDADEDDEQDPSAPSYRVVISGLAGTTATGSLPL